MEYLKKQALAYCVELVADKIQSIKSNINAAQESANEETKSSAGDKYETGRAMMQLQIEKEQKRLLEAQNQEAVLKRIQNRQSPSDAVILGSLVQTNQGWFYISTGLGAIQIAGLQLFAVSLESPIGRLLSLKKVGAEFDINTKKFKIESIW